MNFFPHAEGYASANGNNTDGYKFFYVYNYTDHLGNIRVSYGKDPETGTLKILEENHYYPFGLKHTNYNSGKKKFDLKELAEQQQQNQQQALEYRIKQLQAGEFAPYNYKYQGQERQDELGLNWDSFKWRNYDYAIGRFMCIDPLAEKYTYNSTYAFQENKMGLGRELEGLELVPTNPINFNSYANSVVPALKNFGNSIIENIGKTADKVAEVAGNTGTYVKVVAVVGGVASALTPGFEEFTPGFVEMYNAGDKMSTVATVAKSTSLVTQGKLKGAGIEGTKEVVGNKIGGKINKIEGVNEVTKVILKAVTGEVTDKGAEKASNEVKEEEKKSK